MPSRIIKYKLNEKLVWLYTNKKCPTGIGQKSGKTYQFQQPQAEIKT